MTDREDIGSVVDEGLEDRVACEFLGDEDRDGSDPGDLTDLSRHGMASPKRRVIDPKHQRRRRPRRTLDELRGRGVLGQLHHRVERQRFGFLAATRLSGLLEQLVLARLERGHHPCGGVDRTPHLDQALDV